MFATVIRRGQTQLTLSVMSPIATVDTTPPN